jgi:two-component system response regulator (stage 0 sporulation protein F)
MTILIADDNERIRKLLRNIVGGLFEEIYECGDGQQAVESYRKNKPDWTLMDIEMPVMDGITATREIKKINPDANIIIVTNYDSRVLRKGAKEAGAVSYIMKENLSELNDIFK